MSSEEADVDFREIINGGDLSGKGVQYEYEGVEKEVNKNKESYHMRISSTGVLKSIDKMLYPKINLEDYKKKMPTVIDVPIDMKPEKLRFVLKGKNHCVITFYHN